MRNKIISFLKWLFESESLPVEDAILPPRPTVATNTPIVPVEAPKSVEVKITPTAPLTNREKLYNVAASCLGTHQTLDLTVPNEVGCAEAWSSVAKKAGVLNIPKTGIAGTSNLYAWLVSNSAFKSVTSPLPGDTVISPTGHGNGTVEGHVGFIAKEGILSNNSDNGLFQEKWTLDAWKAHYGVAGGLPVAFFRWV